MIAALAETMDNIFYGPAVVSFCLAVVVFQIVVLVMALRRRRRGVVLSLTVHAIALAAIAVMPALASFSLRAARALMFDVMTGTNPDLSAKAAAMSRGLAGQMNTIPFAGAVTVLASLLWFVALTFTLSAPRSTGRARGYPLVALVGLGLYPTALGAVQWSTGLIKAFASGAGLTPDEKLAIISRTLDAGRAELTQYARVSMVVIPILAVVASVLVVVSDRRRDAAPEPAQPPSPRLPLALSAAAIVLAALLVLAARPMAAENALPWPSTIGGGLVFPGAPPTPDLVGPDAIERAPVILVRRNDLGLDGTTGEDFESLESKLTTLRNNYRLLNPGADFNEMALILADPATSIGRLTSTLRAVRGAWYSRPLFAFTKTETLVRPMLGRLQRTTATGARIKVAFPGDRDDDDPDEWRNAWKDPVPLRVEDFADYDGFARRLVALRRAGKPVIVKVDRAAP